MPSSPICQSQITEEVLDNELLKILGDPAQRKAFAKTGFPAFCLVYFSHYLTLDPGEFHEMLMTEIADDTDRFLEIIGFRGSSKTTMASLCYAIYAAVEKPELYQFIVLASDTSAQVGMNIANIKEELENNQLLIEDYGELKPTLGTDDESPDKTFESDDEWQKRNMLLMNGVRIIARSRGQKVRGLRHRQHRIKLAIVDDPEDADWTMQKENRDKTENWLRGQVMPAIDQLTGRLILIGNYLHNDALMARAKNWGIFKLIEIPLVDENGVCVWPAMYPTLESLIKKRQEMGAAAWMREMMLKVVQTEGQEVLPKDIHYYTKLPLDSTRGLRGHGVNLAISQKNTADFTAIVSGDILYAQGDKTRIYILPNVVNARLNFNGMLDKVNELRKDFGQHMFFVEAVSFQRAAIEEMERKGINVVGLMPMADKAARLRVAATHIRNGTVVFPMTGCEELLQQVFSFPTEKHDDQLDGLVYLILGLLKDGIQQRVVHLV